MVLDSRLRNRVFKWGYRNWGVINQTCPASVFLRTSKVPQNNLHHVAMAESRELNGFAVQPPGGCGSVLESIILTHLLRKTCVCAGHVYFLANESPGVASLSSLLSRRDVRNSSSPQTAANRLRRCWKRLTGVKSRSPGSFSTFGAFLRLRFFSGTPFLEASEWCPLCQVLPEASPMDNSCFSS